MSTKEKIKCRECGCVNEAESKCKITGHPVKLDSERFCKLGYRKHTAVEKQQ